MTGKSSDKDDDDRRARQARADAIRHARDRRNAELNAPPDEDDDATAAEASAGADDTEDEVDSAADEKDAAARPPAAPNFVDFVDRKMRKRDGKG